MTNTEQRKRTRDFIAHWTGRGYEKGESQKFWLELLELLGAENPFSLISFEDQVHLDHTSFIDGFIPTTHVLIEQKSLNKDLRSPIKQSDGTWLTPFQQAKRYSSELPYSKRPRWIVTCNFAEFLVYDMEQPNGEPTSVLLKDLEKELYRLRFLTKTQDTALQHEMEISLAAGELVGRLYDALLKQYIDPTSEHSLKSLNALCVRLVFCLYAEDAGLFPTHNAFRDLLAEHTPDDARNLVISLFRILDTKPAARDPYARPELLAFPYVNGGLFKDESIEIPRFTPEILHLLLKDCSADFDWSGISPTIFGAVFESTLNPETRRGGGMHYTSIENIHKVIDPLFLDNLTDSFESIEKISQPKKRNAALLAFQDRLASLTFLDPACGSGNFLTETFLSLRRLENRVLKLLRGDSRQITFGGDFSPIKVSISQFYGIEINDFAATVAKTALWIAESQMMKETEDIVGRDLDFLPLKTYTNITEGNALRLDWREVVGARTLLSSPSSQCNDKSVVAPTYIMGNPPFVGYSLQSKEQKADILSVFVDEKGKPYKTAGKIDYVAGWYMKAAQLIQGTATKCAFVSTNSITQGEQVAAVWKPLFKRFNLRIDFAHRTFRWDSEATLKAHVHCVIVGFSYGSNDTPVLAQTQGINDNDRSVVAPTPHTDRSKDTLVLAQTTQSNQGNDKSVVAPAFRISDAMFLKRNDDVKITTGVNLPHWEQTGKMQYITFRLADSLPQTKLNEWKREKDEWLRQHPKPWKEEDETEYYEKFGAKIDAWLDASYGSCVLRNKAMATAVEECLRHSDGVQYNLLAYVIMPNHVHVLAQVLPEYDTAHIVKSWKGVSANKINKLQGSTGSLWEKDYFDRLVRNEAHLAHIIKYIEHNYSNGGIILQSPNRSKDTLVLAQTEQSNKNNDKSVVAPTPHNGRSKDTPVLAQTTQSNQGNDRSVVAPVIFDGDTRHRASHINAYLIDAPDVFVESRRTPLCNVPQIGIGNQPIDGGNYLFTKEEMEEFIRKEPAAAQYFKPWYGSVEFIHRLPRYCLWLGDCTPAEINRMPECKKRVAAVREFRLASSRKSTLKLADTPTHFQTENMPKGNYIVIPEVSSEKRRYVPMGFFTPDILCSNLVKIIPNATLYHFGVLTSNVHMAWMRAVCGRLESRYRYSKDIVYNNFPWPPCGSKDTLVLAQPAQSCQCNDKSVVAPSLEKPQGNNCNDKSVVAPWARRIEETAQAILDARALYPDSSLAELYDETLMPPELRKAHQANDRAVMAAYGFPIKGFTESDCVAALMRMYQELAQQ